MKHVKLFEDYTNKDGKTVNTKNTDTKYKMFRMDYMQKFLDKKGIKYPKGKGFDELHKIFTENGGI